MMLVKSLYNRKYRSTGGSSGLAKKWYIEDELTTIVHG